MCVLLGAIRMMIMRLICDPPTTIIINDGAAAKKDDFTSPGGE